MSLHNRTTALRNSQQLGLPAQDPHKIKSVGIPTWRWEAAHEPPLLPEELWTADGFWERKSQCVAPVRFTTFQ